MLTEHAAERTPAQAPTSFSENYEMKGEAAKKPLEDIVVSTEGTSEINGQQNGDVKHTEPPYEPQTESGTFPKAPVITAALPKSVVIRDRGRFIIECFVPGFPKPNGMFVATSLAQRKIGFHSISVIVILSPLTALNNLI